LAAKRTILRPVSDYVERCQRYAWSAYLRLSSATIDNRPCRQGARAGGFEYVDHFACAATGCDHVFHNYGRFARLQGESAAKNHLAGGGIALGEQEPGAQRARHFVSDDQTSQGGRHDGGDDLRSGNQPQLAGQPGAQALGVLGVLQNQSTLQILRAVQAAGQLEMSAEVGARLAENVEDGLRLRRHKRLLYHCLHALL